VQVERIGNCRKLLQLGERDFEFCQFFNETMLKTLYIKNFALIDELTIEFGSGLNIITGETGAGKSILIGALGVVLGERANQELIRAGADKAIIEAVIDATNNERVKSLLTEHQHEFRDEMILRRELSIKGQSRCFINDSPATLALLKAAGELSIDLHGQHEHQSLLRVDTHLRFLDEYGGLGGLLEEYHTQLEALRQSKKKLESLQQQEKTLLEKKALLEFQIREIDAIAPEENEEEALITEQNVLENSEKLFSETSHIHEILYGADDSVHNRLVQVRNLLQDLARIDKSFSEPAADAHSAQVLVDEITKFVQSYNSRLEFNAERLEEVRERLVALQMLKRKYGEGNSLQKVLSYRKKIGEELSVATNFHEEISKIEKSVKQARGALSEIAIRLSQKRREVSKRLSRTVVEELAKLGIPNAKFEVAFKHEEHPAGDIFYEGKHYTALSNGLDHIEFKLSTNLGEEPKPLVKVASGGEISRVMLALKSVLAKSDRLPILVFDEIDTGISGKIAQTVGLSMKELSRYHQIIAITHLPQIAALADVHFRVRKESDNGRTVSRVEQLSHEEHQYEVARLLSGASVTEATLKSAQELIAAGRNISDLPLAGKRHDSKTLLAE
jgi:DNA repair protein RecN (Recombination protein N)